MIYLLSNFILCFVDCLSNLETQVAAGRAWRERASRVFLKKNSSNTLLDVLCPRTDLGIGDSRRNKKKQIKEGESTNSIPHAIFAGLAPKELQDRKYIVKVFKDAENREIQVRIFKIMKLLLFFMKCLDVSLQIS